MDVTSKDFAYHLPRILDELATCCFVSLDFEFSGIAFSSIPHGPAAKPQTLQSRYTDTKNAAEQYQVLQIGLTICHEDITTGTYTLKPYNLYLSPSIDPKLEIPRNVTFQVSAAEFLLENNFSMDSFFKHGVRYLSRDEGNKAIAKATERRDRTEEHRSLLDVKDTDHESIEFMQAVRRLVDDWVALGDARDSYLNIPPPTRITEASPTSAFFPSTLDRFQKRLVHQLIQLEYPSLVTIGKPAFIQIMNFDEEREKAVRNQRVRVVQERMWRQTGFKWIAEALTGGDLSNLDPAYFMAIMSSSAAVEPGYSMKAFADKLKQRLKSQRPVIVGHNLFTDLIYFCNCFFGPLPDQVEDFQAMVHEMFPILMDTKYMATHDCGSINPISSLSEINDSLLKTAIPRMTVHPHHSKYHAQKIDHEAGYDSLLTAQIFIKLSAQLRDGGTSKHLGTAPLTPQPNPSSVHVQKASGLRTRFDVLQTDETIDTTGNSIPAAVSVETRRKVNNGELIPRLDAEFWKNYGNRLRVFGTEERIDAEHSDDKEGAGEEKKKKKKRKKCKTPTCSLRPTFLELIGDEPENNPWTRDLSSIAWEMSSGSNGARRIVSAFRPSAVESRVCRSCQQTLGRRNYASAATAAPTEASATDSTTFPVVKPSYTINAGVVLSRPPQITRDLTPFEKAYYFYQKRLNERQALPFTKYFYFKRGTPADEDWKRKIRERQTPARDIGKYNAYSKEAWNDELLLGAQESEPDHQVEMLVQDAEATANATSQDTSKKEEIPRPFPRVTEADRTGNQKSLDRLLQNTLYLVVQHEQGYWKFPSSPVEAGESLRLAAERTLAQTAGVNMNTWMVGYHPVGHHVYNNRKPHIDQATGEEILGEKTFFMKGRIMAGQADLTSNMQNIKDFKWLSKEEILQIVQNQYAGSIKNMLASR